MSPATPAEPPWPVPVLDHLTGGVLLLAPDGTVTAVNAAGAHLLAGQPGGLTGRDLWTALPHLRGSVFHSFLLHARTAGSPVTWQGFSPSTGRWLTATAQVVGDLLLVELRDAGTDDGEAERERLRFLAEVFESVTTLDVEESAEQLARLVVPRLADWATVTVLGADGTPDRAARAHRDPDRLPDVDRYLAERVHAPRDQSSLNEAMRSGEPVQFLEVTPGLAPRDSSDEALQEAWRRLDPTSVLFVPLHARGEPIGVLSLIRCGAAPPHDEAEIATAVEVARRASLALDNARLHGRRVQVAETLQHSLLTSPPRLPGLDLAVRYRPAGTDALVGGDWYDAFALTDGGTALVIGDVVGHNVEAAAAMAQLRSAVRTLAYDRPDSPARTLDRVDRVLTGLDVGSMATALIARLDRPRAGGRRRLRWSSAGHPPPVLVRADGTVQVLDSPPELLLGTGDPGRHTDHELPLSPGDTVVMVTDGLVEAGRTGIDAGMARLAEALGELAGLAADALCDRLLGRIVPERAEDDVAVLALRVLPA
ncbi:SpoIIE family protein phosphatase [Blastococcus sp. SYSU D00820]